jgi:hypothetical protein
VREEGSDRNRPQLVEYDRSQFPSQKKPQLRVGEYASAISARMSSPRSTADHAHGRRVRMKPLLIGEMPSRSGDRYHAFPLSGAVAQTLCQMAGSRHRRRARATGAGRGRSTTPSTASTRSSATARGTQTSRPRTCARFFEASSEYEVVVLLGRRAQSGYVRMTYPAESPVSKAGLLRVGRSTPTARPAGARWS